ncbi:3-ketoacyl-ACP reductase [Massilia sp. Root133]|uniref:SDR family oxidoreductase n=1 Tax=unclassified Massilia TaxID=2609279 RepID=UPI0007008AD3|nr:MULTISPECIES: SDR family oxidoreductase [unclassified Massilia]KQY01396.1 3-ketoacyl-ACP reductase [Massilia sp. Root133]KQZ48346.1 3-ketoacyl-ACP reductase [Massilia sp. Root1485]
MNTQAKHTARVALVTGASRGIGAAVAKRLAADGYAVAVNYAGNEAAANATVAAIEAAGGRAIAVRADVAKVDDVKAMFAAIEEKLGRVDILVNNAGILPYVTIAETTDEQFERTMAINVTGTFNTMREAATRLNDGGRIVNFSTSVLHMAPPTYGVYVATKGAVEALTRVFAKELRGRGITCNAVAPGPVATELFLTGKSDELIQQIAKSAPLERLGQPDDIAGVVSFLAGPDGGWVNGQILRANGGMA